MVERRRLTLGIAVFAALVSTALPGAAAATTRYASPTGSESAPAVDSTGAVDPTPANRKFRI